LFYYKNSLFISCDRAVIEIFIFVESCKDQTLRLVRLPCPTSGRVMGGQGQGQPPARDFQDIELLRCYVTKRNISLTSNVTSEDMEALASPSLTNKKLVILRKNSARRFNRTTVNAFISLRHIVDFENISSGPDVGLKISSKF